MARLTAFLVWALVAASAVFWGLRVFARPLTAPPHVQPVATSSGSPAAVVRMLAAGPAAPASAPPPAASARFRLLGVMAPREAGRAGGVALISIDGQPPRAYRPGAVVESDLVLQQLGPRSATFGPAGGAGAFTLELPELPPPQTGVLPPLANGMAVPGAPSVPPPPSVMPSPQAMPGQPGLPDNAPPPPGTPQPQPSALPAEPTTVSPERR